jgi:hypothetical protein
MNNAMFGVHNGKDVRSENENLKNIVFLLSVRNISATIDLCGSLLSS